MIPRSLDDIDKSVIDSLVAGKTAERRTLDYKELLPGGTDEEKKEFLYDVSSFANAGGGDLIFGITDQKGADGRSTGIPEAANGVSVTNISAEIARLENLLQSSISPRIPSTHFHKVEGFPSGPMLILRTPKSWAAPHMLTYKGVSRFYSRNSTGKYPLDVFEIRAAFAVSEALPERLRAFRQTRLAAIVAGETPHPLPEGAKVVLHLIPIASLSTGTIVDVRAASPPNVIESPAPIAGAGWDTRFNFDGLLTFSLPTSSSIDRSAGNYVQLFRNGAIEAVDTRLLEPFGPYPDFIAPRDFNPRITNAIQRYIDVQKRLGLVPPVSVMLTLLGVKGFRVATGPRTFSEHGIDRDTLFLPDVIMEDYKLPIRQLLKPLFDTIAQAAGLNESEDV